MQKTVVRILFRCLSSGLLVVTGGLVGCVAAPPPYEEFAIARAAIKAAQDVDSARYAPGLWGRADESFRTAQKEYRDRDFDLAKKHFQSAIQFAEKAENATRLKKFQSGDSFP